MFLLSAAATASSENEGATTAPDAPTSVQRLVMGTRNVNETVPISDAGSDSSNNSFDRAIRSSSSSSSSNNNGNDRSG